MRVFRVLELTTVIKTKSNEFTVTSSSYAESCVVEDLETGEIISVDGDNYVGIRKEILNKVDEFDLIVGDNFRI
jgi:hypothetical protein